ncbi:hypothetical protein GLYMA_13G066800v4 [Glycine max]|uniref:Protein ENHANCED DISEASE RESISTANCE 2 C-terminal domain-containing protein n=2 Tax=Glycine max TaxID=3847 RepID=A0A0R0GUF3_SOYBN|nr:hypothetical protein GYH30_035357 [Glycine max]KRH18539.1 hypothetical protein GLYMA_13G066800v4 [Glycine max]|eukprot:XP_006593664.1 uncharacterized protein LOC100797844 isoform X2 [Glycine max]
MGVCGSRPKVNEDLSAKKKNNHHRRRRRRILRRRVSSRKIEANNVSHYAAWFDSTSALDSECDDEFYSVYDDGMSLNEYEIGSRPNDSSPKGVDSVFVDHQQQKQRVHPYNYFRSNSSLKVAKNQGKPKDSTLKSDGSRVELDSVSTGEVSTGQADEIGEYRKLSLDHCGILPNTCLPCLTSNALAVEKRRPMSPDTPSSRRKSLSKLSFKWREGSSDMTLLSPKAFKQKHLAGSSIPFCPIEKQTPGSWSQIEPSSFRVRGKNYFRDKKKDFAPGSAAFYPLGADLFLSSRKIDHIARFIQIPSINVPGDVPSILIVNIQIPLYPATIFQSENDGEGMNVVLYFKLSEKYSKDLPDQFRESISKLINDEVERVKGFPLDTIAPFRERLKILGRVANLENLSLSTTEKKLMNAYNEKPVLSRPQHEFFLGENYLEIDLDVHRFSYIARKGFEGFIERLKLCNLDFGLTIQGNKAEDLPEHLLCAIRLNKLDYSNFNQFGF